MLERKGILNNLVIKPLIYVGETAWAVILAFAYTPQDQMVMEEKFAQLGMFKFPKESTRGSERFTKVKGFG